MCEGPNGPPGWFHLHAAELEAVGVGLVVGGQVVVVKDPDPEHGGVNAGTQEEDGDEARHLVETRDITHLSEQPGRNTPPRCRHCNVTTVTVSPRCTGSCTLAQPAG